MIRLAFEQFFCCGLDLFVFMDADYLTIHNIEDTGPFTLWCMGFTGFFESIGRVGRVSCMSPASTQRFSSPVTFLAMRSLESEDVRISSPFISTAPLRSSA